MKALVAYESMFGNTEEIARAIADGLGESVEVQLAEVSDNPDVALIVVGGPTHAFSMSWTSTRVDAINRGATEGETAPGSAAKDAAKAGRRHGYDSAAQAESFYVREVGPRVEGEVDRARAWARHLATSMTRAPG
jgi:hypothetical protein